MKNLLQNMILVIIITIIILFSYAVLQNKISGFHLSEFYHFLTDGITSDQKTGEKKNNDKEEEYKAVWVSYLEFNAFRNSVNNNNEETFKKFYQRILNRSKKCGFNRIIVHVRPFGDALYQSETYPWAACISGEQGKNPGYDPLKIMIEMTHAQGMKIEAWINPYRISSGDSLKELSEDNPARIWASSKETKRNVLTYNNALYYNPSSKDVQTLIINGVKEIIKNYDVDGIHMDDYFYPTFTEKNVTTAFDSQEYNAAKKNGIIDQTISIADWRRNNVNTLVSDVYQTIKEMNKDLVFGISPAGNLSNLRSELEYYVDIDTWIQKRGYVDYIMPQIYWGFTNKQAPFREVANEWVQLTKSSDVKLYLGLQLYRMGTSDKTQSDYEELQKEDLIDKEFTYMKKEEEIKGYCFFSYQYLDVDNKNYAFDSNEFSSKRKKLLKKIEKNLEEK